MATDKNEREDAVSNEGPIDSVEKAPVEARQGVLGRPVLMVLICGLIAAAVAWAVVGQYGKSIEPDSAEPKPQATTNSGTYGALPNQRVIDNTPLSGERMQPAPADRDPTPQTGTGGDSQSIAPTGTEKTQ